MTIKPLGTRTPVLVPLLAAAVMLAGCTALQPLPKESGDAPPQPFYRPDGSVRVDTDDEAVAELWTTAERARQSGDDTGALNALYDALELQPQNSLLWSRAAELQLDAAESAQAENYAVRSNQFAGENQALLYRNWLIIEHARNMRGDLLGVRSAHKKVQQYQYQ